MSCPLAEFDLQRFGPSSPAAGSKVWFAARYVNAKGAAGPVSALASTFLGGGVSEAA